jgi:hypothetical protein
MAKQNVTFAERHLEKFVVGAAGLIALGTIALYGVTSPNKVTVEGEDLGPKALFAKLKMTAESAQQSIQRKKPDELPRLPDAIGTKGGPHKVANLPLDYVVGAYAPNPKVPSVIGSDVGGTLVLAPVLPPKAVTVCYGHASAALPPMQVIQVGSTAQQSQQNTGLTPVPNDYAWALVTAVVDRKAQKAEYEKAKYDERYSQLVLASMQTERRELGPDGRWSEPKLIRGYAEQVLTGDASVKPTQSEGATTFTEAQHIYINEYRSKLYTPEAQAGVLRPPFQQLLDKQVLAWQPPKTLPGYEFKWTDWGVSVPVEGESQPGLQPQYQPPIQRPGGFQPMQPGQGPRIRGPQPPPAGPAGPPSGVEEIKAQKKARELIKKAKEAIDKKTDEGYLEADRILQEVIANSTTPTKERDEAESLRKFIEREVAKALNHALQKEDQEKKLGIVTLGKDVEPAWLTDVSVEPGKTYQYRLRFVAFNVSRTPRMRSACSSTGSGRTGRSRSPSTPPCRFSSTTCVMRAARRKPESSSPSGPGACGTRTETMWPSESR